MTKKEKTTKEIIEEAVTETALAQYLTASWGERFGVYPDGTVLVSQDVGREIAEVDMPLVWVKCPGIGNIGSDWWTREWTEELENGMYRVRETGEEIDLAECIRRSCEEGDVVVEKEALVNELLDDVEAD